MPVDDEDRPDLIPDLFPDDIIDDEDDEEFEYFKKIIQDIQRYIKKNKLTATKAKQLRQQKTKELRKLLKDLTLILFSEAYERRETYSDFIRKQEKLRRSVLTSLLSGLSVDGKIIVVQDLLRMLEGDDEPPTYYIW